MRARLQAVAVAAIVVVRPLAGWVGLLGSPADAPTRAALAFFGVRGMGTIYYLAHAVTEEAFPEAREVWSIAILTIVLSIVVHGTTASIALAGIERKVDRDRAGQTTDLDRRPPPRDR